MDSTHPGLPAAGQCPFTRFWRWSGFKQFFGFSPGPAVEPFPELPLQPDVSGPDGLNPAARFMSDVQGNILSAHRRGDHVGLWLFAFANPSNHQNNCDFVNAAAERVTSALDQHQGRADDGLRSLLLTGAGLLACGADGNALSGSQTFPPDMRHFLRDGMNQRTELAWMHDLFNEQNFPTTWQCHFTSRLDGVWLISAPSSTELDARLLSIRSWSESRGGRHIEYEHGRVWRPKRPPAEGVPPSDSRRLPPREPFGYIDGISIQRFFQRRMHEPHLLSTELDQVFLQGELNPLHRGGSFMVLRKLDQNVHEFRRYQQAAGQAAADAVIGRTPDGAPLAPRGKHPNDFDFSNDIEGKQCPFSAHIRRANPRAVRDQTLKERLSKFFGGKRAAEHELHMVRRGVVYGSDADLEKPEGAKENVGLLFMAYMSSLQTFRVLQGEWFRHPDFPVANRKENAADALIFGLPKVGTNPARQWVTPKGGAYFYAPSLPWMRSLQPEVPTPPSSPALPV